MDKSTRGIFRRRWRILSADTDSVAVVVAVAVAIAVECVSNGCVFGGLSTGIRVASPHLTSPHWMHVRSFRITIFVVLSCALFTPPCLSIQLAASQPSFHMVGLTDFPHLVSYLSHHTTSRSGADGTEAAIRQRAQAPRKGGAGTEARERWAATLITE